jgi:hypothetical protein
MFWEFRLIKFDKETTYVRWITIFGFTVFLGLRGFVYTDWMMYYPLFDKLPTIWDGGLTSVLTSDFSEDFVTDVSMGKAGLELGFIYFTVIFKSLIPNYFAFIFINSFIDVLLLDIFFRKYSNYYVLSFILFIAFGGLGMEFNLLRNMKSFLFFLLSLKYVQERRFLPFVLLNLAGYLFHSSALVFIPLYFILHKEWPKWLVWSIFIAGNILFLLHIKYLQPITLAVADLMGGRMAVKAKLYFVSDFYSQAYGLGIGYIERVCTFIVFILFQKKLKALNPFNVIFINVYLLYFIIYFFFAELMVAVERLSLLFVFGYWVIYPAVLSIIKEYSNKLIMIVLLIGYSILKVAQVNSNIFSKYDNLLFGIQSFEDRKMIIENNMDEIFKVE